MGLNTDNVTVSVQSDERTAGLNFDGVVSETGSFSADGESEDARGDIERDGSLSVDGGGGDGGLMRPEKKRRLRVRSGKDIC